MPSGTLAAKSVDETTTGMEFSRDKRSTTHSSKLAKDKSSFPSRIKNVDLLEKVEALKTEKLPRQTAKDQQETKKSSVASPLGTPQKPWPGRQLTGFDEPVMNMSNVSFYLQCKDKRDNVHERSLSVGVLEWGILEKGANSQQSVTEEGGGDSESSSIETSSFSGFSNHSGRTPCSPPKGENSPVFPCKNSPVSSCPFKMYEKDDSNGSSIASKMFPIRHKDHLDENFCSGHDLSDHKHDRVIGRDLNVKTMSCEVHQPQHSITSVLRHEAEATAARVTEDHNCSLIKEEKSVYCSNSPPLTNNMLLYTHYNEGLWDHLQESADSGCLNSDLLQDFELTCHYPQLSHSCPLPLVILDDEPELASNLTSLGVAPTGKLLARNGGTDPHGRGECKQIKIDPIIQQSRETETKAKVSGKKKLSIQRSSAGPKKMNKSSSSRESSNDGQFEPVSFSNNSRGDQATRNNKGRQSPLRRILDPIMKPKNNTNLSGISSALPSQHSDELRSDKSLHGLNKPSNTKLSSACQQRGTVITSNEISKNDKGTQNNVEHEAPMKQALLQLAWKNGLPLFMFSSCDGEVLAAAIRMRSICNNEDLECIYRVFSVTGSKKKSMFWSSGTNKRKKHQFISNIVAQLDVSLTKLKSYEFGISSNLRTFVLHDAFNSTDSSIASELAAIVVGAPLQNNGIEHPGVSVILPRGTHGSTTEGKPSTLIERWSSGACDCGGWDEGCILSILVNKFQEYNTCASFQGSQTAYGTNRFELFIQGGFQENRHAFSMVSFKEGLYTIDFQPSISLLQAFAICIALLHGRKPNNHLNQRSLQEHTSNDQVRKIEGGNRASLLPNHPPLSPFGRA